MVPKFEIQTFLKNSDLPSVFKSPDLNFRLICFFVDPPPYFGKTQKLSRFLSMRSPLIELLVLDKISVLHWTEHRTLLVKLFAKAVTLNSVSHYSDYCNICQKPNVVILIGRGVDIAVGHRSGGQLATTLVDCYFHHSFKLLFHFSSSLSQPSLIGQLLG